MYEITTYSGKQVNPFNIRLEDLDINDIAHSLSLLNRFLGHTVEPYSVAEHSVRVSCLCEPRDALAGLLHDASEAYLGDVSTPIKNHPCMEGYRTAEWRAMHKVIAKWGLSGESLARVRVVDETICATEGAKLFFEVPAWTDMRDKYWFGITPWPWKAARLAFLERFKFLMQFPCLSAA